MMVTKAINSIHNANITDDNTKLDCYHMSISIYIYSSVYWYCICINNIPVVDTRRQYRKVGLNQQTKTV